MTNLIEQKELEELLMSDDFGKLTDISDKFNVFKVLKLENSEIRHSNFLGWLLNPCENHLMGDYFLKEFLKMIIKDHSTNSNVSASISDIVLNDFMDTEVTLEKLTDEGRRIDILLESRKNQFVCVIENKIWSDEGCNQLEDYYKYINAHEKYKSYKHKLFVFLTPKKEYDCTQLYKNYIRYDYEKICQAIDKLLKNKQNIIEDDVKYFIENYKEMVERNIMGIEDKETVELCRKIYRNYKNAIDLINKCGNTKTAMLEILKEALEEQEGLNISVVEKDGIICLPDKINDVEKLKFANWVPDDCIVHLHFMNCCSGHKDLCLGILFGPAKDNDAQNKRQDLIKHINEKLEIKLNAENKDWSYSDAISILSVDQFYECESSEDVKRHIQQKLNAIKELYIDKLRAALNSWIAK